MAVTLLLSPFSSMPRLLQDLSMKILGSTVLVGALLISAAALVLLPQLDATACTLPSENKTKTPPKK
ncbi:hypothetical protein RIF25_11425 [Thermosynechococcaceae cyanobacterium BACA0444]|uniref:Uncharacterized protein n=1 Tax=Pseudocalidococcus azoricus BACA0444 TaxID=2918990 RepID=A0AAE4K003_9CYAN|nr:hypothetical protein [Pseudocalidococcus azoricus]MDS3861417.1 hypothetical protein [Pseudocalidococcus azoricus BACA0444]